MTAEYYAKLAITTLRSLWSDPPTMMVIAAKASIQSELWLTGSDEAGANASVWCELILAQNWIRSAPLPSVFAARGQA